MHNRKTGKRQGVAIRKTLKRIAKATGSRLKIVFENVPMAPKGGAAAKAALRQFE